MFKIDKKTNKITLTKGDNAQLEVKVFDVDGKQRELFEDDSIVLTVKKSANADTVAFQKVAAADGTIDFVPSDTKALASGLYVYDIQVTTFSGKIYTVIPLSNFEIGEEVTK